MWWSVSPPESGLISRRRGSEALVPEAEVSSHRRHRGVPAGGYRRRLRGDPRRPVGDSQHVLVSLVLAGLGAAATLGPPGAEVSAPSTPWGSTRFAVDGRLGFVFSPEHIFAGGAGFHLGGVFKGGIGVDIGGLFVTRILPFRAAYDCLGECPVDLILSGRFRVAGRFGRFIGRDWVHFIAMTELAVACCAVDRRRDIALAAGPGFGWRRSIRGPLVAGIDVGATVGRPLAGRKLWGQLELSAVVGAVF